MLGSPIPEPGTYVLTGPEQISIRQAVAVLSALLDRPLSVHELSFEEALACFPASTPELCRRSLLETLGEAASALAPTTDVEHLTGRPARTFSDWASERLTEFAVPLHAADVDRR